MPVHRQINTAAQNCSQPILAAETRRVEMIESQQRVREQIDSFASPGKARTNRVCAEVITAFVISAKVGLEREVRMQDRLAAIGRLSAAIAHEIRNPLTWIAGSATLLSGLPGLNDEHRRLLQIVTRESERLNGIITDFLSYSRVKQYRFTHVNVLPLLEDTLTLLDHRLQAERIPITLERHYLTQKAFVLADGDRIKQVFWNFCENAVRAMKQGGTLTIAVEEHGEDWQLSFADTGLGISPQMIEKIFEPFSRLRKSAKGRVWDCRRLPQLCETMAGTSSSTVMEREAHHLKFISRRYQTRQADPIRTAK